MVDADKLQVKLRPVFSDFGIKKAVLFGSVAKGTNTKNSDIDIVVDSRLRGLRFLGLLEEIRKISGSDVDLFDYSHIENDSPLAAEIQKTGRIIYEE